MAEKLYYSMGEISEMFDVKPSLIRYWGEQFDVLRPKRNKKGNRMFTPEDVENLKLIYHLVKEQGMTLEGARRVMKSRSGNTAAMARDIELLERLQRVRSILLQVREQLSLDGSDDIAVGEVSVAGDGADEAAAAEDVAGDGTAVVEEDAAQEDSFGPEYDDGPEYAECEAEYAEVDESACGDEPTADDGSADEPSDEEESADEAEPVPAAEPAKDTVEYYEQTLF